VTKILPRLQIQTVPPVSSARPLQGAGQTKSVHHNPPGSPSDAEIPVEPADQRE
jgi:hypothetical protein